MKKSWRLSAQSALTPQPSFLTKATGLRPRDGAIFLREEPKRFVEELRRKKGKDIWLVGGGELAQEFLKDDLVDKLYLGIRPVLIGEGIPSFAAGFPSGNSH